MALRAFLSNPSLGGFGSENAVSATRRIASASSSSSSSAASASLSVGQAAGGQQGGSSSSNRPLLNDGRGSGGSSGNDRQQQHEQLGTLLGDGQKKQQQPKQQRKRQRQRDHPTVGGAACAPAPAAAEGGDAFAQIVKELVDNAVDACCCGDANANVDADANINTNTNTNATDASDSSTKRPALKRIRVVIEPANTSNSDNNGGGTEEGDGSTSPSPSPNNLRISVNDNGTGMASIEDCVEAFRTSKRCDGGVGGGGGGGGGGEAAAAAAAAAAADVRTNNPDPGEPTEQRTAGRYGIGLTLCLLHSQRLCPNSVASITSATSTDTHWTRASYVVDAGNDRVRCVKRETLPKTRPDESGTVVSLLVPGGDGAVAAWPRLAEYFARFQLSQVTCSLEVKAPTLSRVPLYVRPAFEVERRERHRSRRVAGEKEVAARKRKQQRMDSPSSDDESVGSSRDGNGKDQEGESPPSSCELAESVSDEDEWGDGLTCFDTCSQIYGGNEGQDGNHNEGQLSIEEKDADENDDCNGDAYDRDDNYDKSQLTPEANSESFEDKRRKNIQRAASSYLKRPIELRNVAHSINPIRRVAGNANGEGSNVSKSKERPMLEVDMIVYGRQGPDGSSNSDDDEDGSSYGGDDFETMFANGNGRHESGEAATLKLIRMVNRIPLLDSAEASSCGLVRGLSTKTTTWNSYGLDISPLIEDRIPSALHGKVAAAENELDTFIPTYDVKDSAQVAPFFKTNSHALYESNSDDEYGSDDDDEATTSSSQISDGSDDEAKVKSKRKRKTKMTKLLPAGLRIGNVVLIAQIHANPSALPLPTLSKGRLPMNDEGINEALEVGLSSCLRSLQRSNPNLLLTSSQLKRTERDVRYLPAIASSLVSIIKNSTNTNFREDALRKIESWNVATSALETERHSNVKERDVTDSAGQCRNQQSENEPHSDAEMIQSEDDCSARSGNCIQPCAVLNENLNRLNEMKITELVENRLRYCISDENKERKKEIEKEKKLEARREEQEKEQKKQKKKKKRKTVKKGWTYSSVSDGSISESGDASDIDLDDLLLEGAESDNKDDLESSQGSDANSMDESTTARDPGSNSDTDTSSTKDSSGKNEVDASFSDDEDFFNAANIGTSNEAAISSAVEGKETTNIGAVAAAAAVDDGFDDEDDWW